MKHSITEIVKGNTAKFSHYESGIMYYSVEVGLLTYTFPVYLQDINTILKSEEKAVMLIKYVRKAINDKTLVCV